MKWSTNLTHLSDERTSSSTMVKLTLVLLLLLTVGCQEGVPLYQVDGLVQFADKSPVRNATIELLPKDGGPSPRGRINQEGKFQLSTFEKDDGAPEGEYYVVVVQPLSPRAREASRTLGEKHASHIASTQVVAMKHASPDTTGVEVTVKPIAMNEIVVTVDNQ